jgi:hypothetical protein
MSRVPESRDSGNAAAERLCPDGSERGPTETWPRRAHRQADFSPGNLEAVEK